MNRDVSRRVAFVVISVYVGALINSQNGLIND